MFVLHFLSSNFHNIIEFIFSQMQMLIFCFDFLKTNLTIALKICFIFFLTLTCNLIIAKNKKKNDNKNVLNDCSDWEVFLIIRKRSSTTIFRDDNIFSFVKNDFNSSCKVSSACFSMIFEINYNNKLKKRTTD